MWKDNAAKSKGCMFWCLLLFMLSICHFNPSVENLFLYKKILYMTAYDIFEYYVNSQRTFRWNRFPMIYILKEVLHVLSIHGIGAALKERNDDLAP
jgi:hypothetical protein